MKKLFLVVSFLMVLMLVPMAMAYQISTVGGYGPYQTGQGGEFTVLPTGFDPLYLYDAKAKNVYTSGTFQTFCIEGNEYIYANTTFDVIFNTKAVYGSVGPAGDPLSVGAAWLYHEFQIAGNFDGLATYDYTNPGRSGITVPPSSADLLQKAIWWLEGEESIGYDASNPFMVAVVTKFGTEAKAKWDNDGTYGQYPVAVLNLYEAGYAGDANHLRQDVLVCVPEPATMLLLGSGLIGLAGFARKRFKK